MAPIIDQHQFDNYAAAWSRHVSRHQDFTSVFQQADGSQLRAVRFSFETLEHLLSTVGARRIKAQFLLKADKESEEKRSTPPMLRTGAFRHITWHTTWSCCRLLKTPLKTRLK